MTPTSRLARAGWGAFLAAALVFLLAPILMAVPVSLSPAEYLSLPTSGLTLRWYAAALANRDFVEGFAYSAAVAGATAAGAVVLGTPAAVFLARAGQATALVGPLVMGPLVVPAIILGLAMLAVLPLYGLHPGPAALVAGHVVVTVPYVVKSVGASLLLLDPDLELASLGLGRSRVGTFFRVTLPALWPGLVSGALFAFLLSFDNVSISLFLSRGDTLPLRMLQHVQFVADPSIAAVATILIAITCLGVAVLARLARGRQPIDLL